MSAQAGPSRLRHGPAHPLAHQPSREEADLSDLVARLSIQDVDELESRHKGKETQGTRLTDAELALKLFAEEARSVMEFNNDRALAMALSEVDERAPAARASLAAATRPRPGATGPTLPANT